MTSTDLCRFQQRCSFMLDLDLLASAFGNMFITQHVTYAHKDIILMVPRFDQVR